MPDDYKLKSFLKSQRAEVKGMLETEYNEEKIRRMFLAEGRHLAEQERQRAEAAEAKVNIEKARADAAEARIKELESKLASIQGNS